MVPVPQVRGGVDGGGVGGGGVGGGGVGGGSVGGGGADGGDEGGGDEGGERQTMTVSPSEAQSYKPSTVVCLADDHTQTLGRLGVSRKASCAQGG